jgi:hypothetical protein
LAVRQHCVHVIALEAHRLIDLLEDTALRIDDHETTEQGSEGEGSVAQHRASKQLVLPPRVSRGNRNRLDRTPAEYEEPEVAGADQDRIAARLRERQHHRDIDIGDAFTARNRPHGVVDQLHQSDAPLLNVQGSARGKNRRERRLDRPAAELRVEVAQLRPALEVDAAGRRHDRREDLVEARVRLCLGRQQRDEPKLTGGIGVEIPEVPHRADVDAPASIRCDRDRAHAHAGGQLDESPCVAVVLEHATVVGEVHDAAVILERVPVLHFGADVAARKVVDERLAEVLLGRGRVGCAQGCQEEQDPRTWGEHWFHLSDGRRYPGETVIDRCRVVKRR